MSTNDCPRCVTGCAGNDDRGYADPGAFGSCGCRCHRGPRPGPGPAVAPVGCTCVPGEPGDPHCPVDRLVLAVWSTSTGPAEWKETDR